MAHENRSRSIKSVAIIGAGASGAVTAAAFHDEKYFERIRVFERRETAGGTWIFDANPHPALNVTPGALPPQLDPPLRIPSGRLPRTTAPNLQERFEKTPVYEGLTTNVPAIAMSFSDIPFAYGPFVPHYVPRQYLENYFSVHRTDKYLALSTTVEDVSKFQDADGGWDRWRLTLRRYDAVRQVDEWWQEEFDAVVIANGHYSVPFIPEVKGLPEYIKRFPGRVRHSKLYRTPREFAGKKVLVIGNSASGQDVTTTLLESASHPVYQSRRSPSRWDGSKPPPGIEWKPIITEYLPSGRIIFEDGSFLDDIDNIIYSTGYKPSYPFWNSRVNGAELWDYAEGRLKGNYLHTFLSDFPTVGVVGITRSLTFRSFEYQGIALARFWAGRARGPRLFDEKHGVGRQEMKRWEEDRWSKVKGEGKRFHDIEWDTGDTLAWFTHLSEIAGLWTLEGDGRLPPVLGKDVRWALEHIRKYPEPGRGDEDGDEGKEEEKLGWVVVRSGVETGRKKDSLSFI